MLNEELENLRLQHSKQYLKLLEVMKLTEELAQATDRRDEVSVRMLLAMRQSVLLELSEMHENIGRSLLEQPEEEAIRLCAVLNGAEAETPEEEPLCGQLAKNRQLLERISTLDQRLSSRLGGKRSFYNSLQRPTY